MAQFSGRAFRPRQERGVRQGQETVGENRDLRIDELQDGRIELTQIVYTQSDVPVKPFFTALTSMSQDGFRKFVELCNDVLDARDGVEGAPRLPIDRSVYARRGWPLDGE